MKSLLFYFCIASFISGASTHLDAQTPIPFAHSKAKKIKASVGDLPDTKPAEAVMIFQNKRITVRGICRKFYVDYAGHCLDFDGKKFCSVGYAPDGKFEYFFNSQPWLEGNYEKGVMVGLWKLWSLDDPARCVKMDFRDISNRVLKEDRKEVFPYFGDFEGQNKDLVLIVTNHGMLTLSSDSKVVFSSLGELDIGDGRDISLGKIGAKGPYCFWFGKTVKIWDSVDEDHLQWHFGGEWFVYVFKGGKILKIFDRNFDDELDNDSVFLAGGNDGGYKELHCHGVTAFWDPSLIRFVEQPTPIPVMK